VTIIDFANLIYQKKFKIYEELKLVINLSFLIDGLAQEFPSNTFIQFNHPIKLQQYFVNLILAFYVKHI
jgi:hypothetical protein